MKRQTDLQQAIAEGSSSPYVWGDVRLQFSNGWNLEFVIGNWGPTVATNVRVAIDPSLPTNHEGAYIDVMHERLREGLSSLAPGRTLHWTLGPSVDLWRVILHHWLTESASAAIAHTGQCQSPSTRSTWLTSGSPWHVGTEAWLTSRERSPRSRKNCPINASPSL